MAVNTTVQVTLPQMGESVTEGTVLEWHKQEGDHVEVDDVLVEISTDKVDAELPSPASGTLARILAPEGETVSVGAILAEIAPDNGAAPATAESIIDSMRSVLPRIARRSRGFGRSVWQAAAEYRMCSILVFDPLTIKLDF